MKHTTLIGAPRDMTGGSSLAILQRSDEDFIPATFEGLRNADGRRALDALRAQAVNANGIRKLFQPIQRQFHIGLIESWCDTPGEPRVDPARIDSAGMVLRRLTADGRSFRSEGWMRAKGHVYGWLALDRVGGEDKDPGSTIRLQQGMTQVADIDLKLASFAAENADTFLNEHVIPLYRVPPDVCDDASKTLFFGVVPTTSNEISEADTDPQIGLENFGPDSTNFINHLIDALRGNEMAFPLPGQTLTGGWLQAWQSPDGALPSGVTQDQANALAGSDASAMDRFVRLLRQLGSEFNAFEDNKDTRVLRAELKKIKLVMKLQSGEKTPRQIEALDFLTRASTVLLEQGSASGSMEMPQKWPALANAKPLRAAMHAAMLARLASVKGKAGRFDEPAAQYALRPFVRVKCDKGGPPHIIWGDYSAPFVIAPWYDGAGAPPIQIPLPDASDRNMLKALKPNVSFVVPAAMQNLLAGKGSDLMKGTGSTAGPGIAWICSFNIPIITICAFIVLNIFLSLFNIVFGWMFFLKICIPFPKFGNKP